MFITGLGTANPPHRYTQAECWQALQAAEQFSRLDRRASVTLQKVLLGDNGIHTRCLAFTSLDEAFAIDPDTLKAGLFKKIVKAFGLGENVGDPCYSAPLRRGFFIPAR